MIALHAGAVDTIRALMPNVPTMGANRIPMRDEIELEIDL